MPRVKVLNPFAGNWSDYVYGVDKSYLIKSLLNVCFYNSPFCGNQIDLRTGVTPPDINLPVPGIELDMEPVLFKDILAVLYFGHNPLEEVDTLDEADWVDFLPNLENYSVDNVRTVMVCKGLLEALIKGSKNGDRSYLVPAWEKILEMANIPANADGNYTLILRFTK